MKNAFLLHVFCVIGFGIAPSSAQTKDWIRMDSVEQIEEITAPAIAIISFRYSDQISAIQAAIVRSNSEMTEGVSLYEIDGRQLDGDQLQLVLKARNPIHTHEIAVFTGGKWTLLEYFKKNQMFFRKYPAKDSPLFYRQIAEEASRLIETNSM